MSIPCRAFFFCSFLFRLYPWDFAATILVAHNCYRTLKFFTGYPAFPSDTRIKILYMSRLVPFRFYAFYICIFNCQYLFFFCGSRSKSCVLFGCSVNCVKFEAEFDFWSFQLQFSFLSFSHVFWIHIYVCIYTEVVMMIKASETLREWEKRNDDMLGEKFYSD